MSFLEFFLFVSIFFAILKFLFKTNVEYYFFFGMIRIKKGLKFIEKISKNRVFGYFEKISYYLGIFLLIIAVLLVFYGILNLKAIFIPLIPGTEIRGIKMPLLETIIAIFIVAFIHEISHGALIVKNNLKLKNWGLLFIGPFLGAFVEPDEKEIEKLDKKKKIAIYNAGSVSNLLTSFLFLALMPIISIFYSNIIEYTGIKIIEIENNTPAYFYGLNINETIIRVDNYTIKTLYDFKKFLETKKPGDKIIIYTKENKSYELILGEKNDKPYLGVYLQQEYQILDHTKYSTLSFLLSLLYWLFAISLGISIVNMLPIYPLDGGKTIKVLLENKFKEKTNKIVTIISLVFVALIVINISLNFI